MCVHVLHINTAVTKVFIPLKSKLQNLVSTSVNSRQYVVIMSQYENVLMSNCLDTSAPVALVPKYLRCELSWVRCVRKTNSTVLQPTHACDVIPAKLMRRHLGRLHVIVLVKLLIIDE